MTPTEKKALLDYIKLLTLDDINEVVNDVDQSMEVLRGLIKIKNFLEYMGGNILE